MANFADKLKAQAAAVKAASDAELAKFVKGEVEQIKFRLSERAKVGGPLRIRFSPKTDCFDPSYFPAMKKALEAEGIQAALSEACTHPQSDDAEPCRCEWSVFIE